ncbi:MAG: hypothetical protein JWO89_805, partial [Verrucomicrobiaceae bacterium]|nr:hypothetical protein [Verrucomicrobiaceae bacterium]
MEILALLGILLVLWLLVGPVIALVKASKAGRLVDEAIERFRETNRVQSERMDRLMQRLEYLEASFKDKAPFAPQPIPEQTAGLETPVASSVSTQLEAATPITTVDRLEETKPGPVEGGSEYKLPAWSSTPVLTPEPTVGSVDTPAAPPPLPPPFPRPVEPVAKAMSFEQFLGVKMFAWVGGLALFLGIVFFVKYAFERDLIPPAARIAIGFITGMGLLGGGLYVQTRKHFDVLAQTLCATGVLVLYGVTFAAHALYHFAIFNSGVTFGVMTLVTAVAFLLAVRMNAQVVAVLGMVGGFLTPV